MGFDTHGALFYERHSLAQAKKHREVFSIKTLNTKH